MVAGLAVIYRDPRSLNPRATNPRTHSKRHMQQMADSINTFGFVNPALIDQADGIIAGHGRVLAAIQLGMTDVPTLRVDHLSPAQIRAYVIADNKLAENAGWDRQLLAIELKELSVNLDFKITDLGFETAEIDVLIGELDENTQDGSDLVPEVDRAKPAISRPGDLWRIGSHFLYCGDSTLPASYEILMQGLKVDAVFTDPPYNVAIEGNVSGLGKVKHKDFAMASGEMNNAEFTGFLRKAFDQLAAFSADGSLHYICMDWRHTGEMAGAGSAYSELKNICVWVKSNAGMGALYRSQHELVYVFKNGTAKHINNIELGRFGRNRTNVWNYPGVTSFGKERDEALAIHPTVKPVALVADAIMDCTHRGGAVLDAFCGSGTTLVAAEKTGRRGFGIEWDPHYCDTILRRMREIYGLKAVNHLTGATFPD